MFAGMLAPLVVLALSVAALDEKPQGLLLHASAEAAWLDGDPAGGAAVGAGIETAPFGLYLKAPLWIRVWDLPPLVDPSLPPPCRVVRCDDFLPGGTFEWQSLSRVVDELRLFRAGDLFHLRGGPLYVAFSHGLLVDGATNRLEFDRRGSGLYAEANLPFAALAARGLALDLFRPHELAALRVDGRPLSPLFAEDAGFVGRLLGRFAVGVEAAVDATAPTDPASVDRAGVVRPGAPTRPVGGVVVDATWGLLDPGFLQLAPFVAGSAATGLSVDGGVGGQTGVGAAGGVDVSLDAVFAVLQVGAAGTLDGPAHRHGVFDLAYTVERRRALFGASVEGGGVARVPAPGGFGGRLSMSLSVLSAVSLGAKLDLEPAPGGNHAEVFLQGARGPARGALRFVQRGFDDVGGLFAWGQGSILLAEAGFAIWGPFSVFGRWWRAPRFDLQDGVPRMDDDVFVGASFDLALAPAW